MGIANFSISRGFSMASSYSRVNPTVGSNGPALLIAEGIAAQRQQVTQSDSEHVPSGGSLHRPQYCSLVCWTRFALRTFRCELALTVVSGQAL